MTPIDTNKKSNMKCQHCAYFNYLESEDKLIGCTLTGMPKFYWNRCKKFKWREDENIEAPTIQAVPIEVLQDIRQEISDFEEDVFHEPNTDYRAYAVVRHCLDIVDRHIKEYTNETGN